MRVERWALVLVVVDLEGDPGDCNGLVDSKSFTAGVGIPLRIGEFLEVFECRFQAVAHRRLEVERVRFKGR